jgi:hypothetical protein
VANAAQNAAVASSAAVGIKEQSRLYSTLRSQIDRRSAAPVAHSGGTVSPSAPKVASEGGGALAETVSADELEPGMVATGGPGVPVRHDQMQLPVVTPTITEGLGG